MSLARASVFSRFLLNLCRVSPCEASVPSIVVFIFSRRSLRPFAYQPSPPRPSTVTMARMIVGVCDAGPPADGGATYTGLPGGGVEEESGDGVMLIGKLLLKFSKRILNQNRTFDRILQVFEKMPELEYKCRQGCG